MAAAEPAPQKKSANYVQRLVWQVGAQSLVTPARNGTVVSKRVPAPRPRPEVVASAVETTASVPWRWEAARIRHPERPRDGLRRLGLRPARAGRRPRRPDGAGAEPPARAATRKPAKEKTPPLVAARPMQAPAGRLGDNPWLRAG